MTTADHFDTARPRYRHRRVSLSTYLRSAFDMLRRWRRMHRALAELRGLDDRMLDDIGLCRSNLYATVRVRHGFGKHGFRGTDEL